MILGRFALLLLVTLAVPSSRPGVTTSVGSASSTTSSVPPSSRLLPEYLIPNEQGLRRVRLSISGLYPTDSDVADPLSVSFACSSARLYGYIVKPIEPKPAENPLSFVLMKDDGPLILTFEVRPRSACQVRVFGEIVEQIRVNGLPVKTAVVGELYRQTITKIAMDTDAVIEIDATPIAETAGSADAVDVATPPIDSRSVPYMHAFRTATDESIRIRTRDCGSQNSGGTRSTTQTFTGSFQESGERFEKLDSTCTYEMSGVGFDLTQRLVVLLNGSEPPLTAVGATVSLILGPLDHKNLKVFLRPKSPELFAGQRPPTTTRVPITTITTAPPSSTGATTFLPSTVKPGATRPPTTRPATPRPATTRPVARTTVKPAGT